MARGLTGEYCQLSQLAKLMRLERVGRQPFVTLKFIEELRGRREVADFF